MKFCGNFVPFDVNAQYPKIFDKEAVEILKDRSIDGNDYCK